MTRPEHRMDFSNHDAFTGAFECPECGGRLLVFGDLDPQPSCEATEDCDPSLPMRPVPLIEVLEPA